MGDPFSIGRRDGFPAQNVAVMVSCCAWPLAVGRIEPELHFARFGRKRHHRLSIRHEPRFAEAARLVLAHIDEAALLGWRHKDASARGQRDLVAVGREMHRGKIIDGILDPMLAQIVEIGRELDRDGAILAGRDVVQAQIGAPC